MRRSRIFILSCLIFIMMTLTAQSALAQTPTIYIDNTLYSFNPAPVIQKGVTLVPMRAVFEKLGATIDWEPATQTVTATKDDDIISLTIGEQVAYLNGKAITLAVKAQTINDRTMVPLRFVSESLGARVAWDAKTWKITINTGDGQSPTGSTPGNLEITDIAKNSESVALVKTFDNQGNALGLGSGFVIKDGVLLTNYHVIDKAYTATVEFENGRSYAVDSVLTYDKTRDYAVLSIKGTGLVPLTLGDSSKLAVGEKIVAIGNPQGLQNTVTDGIVSAVNRNIEDLVFIQISAPISPGSSGGPLFNMQGQVVGINTAGIVNGQNLNLAIPISEIKDKLFRTSSPVQLKVLNESYYLQQTQTKSSSQSTVSEVPVGLSEDELLNWLYENYRTLDFGGYKVAAHDYFYSELDDGTKAFSFVIDYENYQNMLEAATEGGQQDNIEMALAELAAAVMEQYPNDKVIFSYMLSDYFDSYPGDFPIDSTEYVNGKWRVTYVFVAAFGSNGSVEEVYWFE